MWIKRLRNMLTRAIAYEKSISKKLHDNMLEKIIKRSMRIKLFHSKNHNFVNFLYFELKFEVDTP